MPAHLQILDRGFHGIVHSVAHGSVWASHGRHVMRRRIGAPGWQNFVTLPRAFPRDALAWPRILERASRADQCAIHPVGPELAVVVRASLVWRVTPGRAERIGEIQGDCPLKSGIVTTADGSHLFGEYFTNRERSAVRIWRISPDLSAMEPAHTFPARTVRHIHGIHADSELPGSLWVTTGDDDGECFLWHSSDGLRTLERIGDGRQSCRAVSLFFLKSHISWFTDSNLVQNWRMTLDRKTGAIEKHEPVESSVWYGTRLVDGTLLAATTVEVGPGVKTDHATILASRDGFTWMPIRRFRKDPWRPRGVFKHGVISFAAGAMQRNSIWISGEGLWWLDGRAAECALEL